MDKQKVLDAINSLEIIDSESDCGVINYILAENTESNKEVLLNAGLSEETIQYSVTDYGEALDLSTFAFNYAEWFEVDTFHLKRPVKRIWNSY